jgi:hypothetical protein
MKLLHNDSGRIATAIEILGAAKEFGSIQKYSYERMKDGRIAICVNNGQFHYGSENDIPGYATFIGFFHDDYIEENYDEFLKIPEAKGMGLVVE